MTMRLALKEWSILKILGSSYRGLHTYSLYKATGLSVADLTQALSRLISAEFVEFSNDTQVARLTENGKLFLVNAGTRPRSGTQLGLHDANNRPKGEASYGDARTTLAIDDPYIPRLSELSKKFGKPKVRWRLAKVK